MTRREKYGGWRGGKTTRKRAGSGESGEKKKVKWRGGKGRDQPGNMRGVKKTKKEGVKRPRGKERQTCRRKKQQVGRNYNRPTEVNFGSLLL